jgi:hypothetical protein
VDGVLRDIDAQLGDIIATKENARLTRVVDSTKRSLEAALKTKDVHRAQRYAQTLAVAAVPLQQVFIVVVVTGNLTRG